MGFFSVPEWLQSLVAQLVKASPACLIGILVLGAGAYTYSTQTFAKASELQDFKEVLMTRLAVTDTQAIVRELQTQIRTKEREIADLAMVLGSMNAHSGSYDTLNNRIFTLKQDLEDLKAKLTEATADQIQARQAFARASGK